jgi:hypothetical protein
MTDYKRGVKTAEILVTPPRTDHGVRTILHALKEEKGSVFGLFDIELKDETARDRILHIGASHLEHLAEELEKDANPPRRFEHMLAELNADLLLAADEAGLKADRIHATIGILTKEQVFISGIGKVSALFLHKTADRRYSVYELDAQFHEGRSPEEKRFFLTILDGEIHPGDVFYAATPLSSHALSPNELHDILVTLPPQGALSRIRQFVPPSQAYAALGFSFTEAEKHKGPPKKANPIGSLEALQTSKEQTASVLGEGNAELSNLVKNMAQAASKKLSSPGTKGVVTFLKRILSVVIRALSSGLQAASMLASNIFLSAQQKENRGPKAVILTPKKKLIFVGALAVIVIGVSLIFLTHGNKDKKKDEAAFTASVTQVEQRILAAEASLIYRNTEEAHTSLLEAATILETVPRDTNEHSSKAEELSAKLTELQDKIRGITTVTPQVLATLAGGSLTSAVSTNGRTYAFANNLDVYRLDGLSTSWVKEDGSKGTLQAIKSSAAEGTNILVLDTGKQLGRADLTGKTLNPIASGTNGMASTEDIVTYGGNLYALSAASGQILKMRPQGNAYEGGTAWITSSNSDLSGARAFTVDGDVYLLTATNIIKFRSGKEIDWPHATIDPILVNPTDIWTDLSSKYLYVLDPGSSRVLVFNKESGSIEAQYVSDELKNAVSFIIEETANRIVFVTNEKAFSFTADHLVK